MPDDKSKRGGPDRSRVSADEQYEVAYFAKKHKLTHAQATHHQGCGTEPREGRQGGRCVEGARTLALVSRAGPANDMALAEARKNIDRLAPAPASAVCPHFQRRPFRRHSRCFGFDYGHVQNVGEHLEVIFERMLAQIIQLGSDTCRRHTIRHRAPQPFANALKRVIA